MNKNTLIGFVSLAALAAIVVFFISAAPVHAPIGSVSNEDDVVVRAFVKEFASKFKNVSLLADDAAVQIAREYGPYISDTLSATLQADIDKAPGRHTSSPWPDRIEIVSVDPRADGAYTVNGNVIEITSADAPNEPAAVYPLILTVEPTRNSWLITSLEKGAYSEIPQRTSVVGFWECLPHRDTSGPQTMECAFGIALDQSDGHLAVSTQFMSTYPVDFPTGTKVRIEGILVPIEQISSNMWQKYDIDGIIDATSITKI